MLNSDSKVKIAWGSTQKDHSVGSKDEILSFTAVKKVDEEMRRNLFDEVKEGQGAVFLRKSLNECDQTRDS